MPQVPQYQRQVAPQLTPTPYNDVKVNEDMFGVNVYKAQGNVGRALGDAAKTVNDVMFKLKEQYDRTKIIEGSNELDRWANERLYDKENGYFVKTGKDAMGKSPELLEDYDKFARELAEKSKLRGANGARLQQMIAYKRLMYERAIEAYDKKQSDAWQDMVYADKEQNIMTNAQRNRNNPDVIAQCNKDLNTLIDNLAEIKGFSNDPEKLAIVKQEAQRKLLGNVLDSLIADGSLKSREFYKQNEQYFTPEQRTQYLAKIHTEEVNYTARTTAQGLIGLSTEEAYKVIDSIQNIDERNATEAEYNRLLRHQETIQKEKDDKISAQIMQEVYAAFDKGDDIHEIMRKVNVSDMSLEQKEKIYSNLKSMQELKGAGDAWADYNILMDMAAFNSEEFKNINPANYDLTKEQYNKITEMQRKIANNEYTPETDLRKALKDVSGFNLIQGRNGLHKGDLVNGLVSFVSKIERMRGKAFDINNSQELQAIVDAFDYKYLDAKNKNIDETKELMVRSMKHGDSWNILAKEYMYFKGANKREPNAQEIYEMAKRAYNTVENNWKARNMGELNNAQGVYQAVSAITPKKGETKVLTYYADTRIPQISRELGIPLQVTSRYRAGDAGGHGKGRKCDVGMTALNQAQRITVFEKMLSEPAIGSIGTSDPILLKRFNSPPNPKIRDLRAYDADYKKAHPNTTMNHVNHIDISFDTRYGGDGQGS